MEVGSSSFDSSSVECPGVGITAELLHNTPHRHSLCLLDYGIQCVHWIWGNHVAGLNSTPHVDTNLTEAR